MYRQPFRLLLPDGHDTYRTFIGSILSVITIVTIAMYGTYKFTELMGEEDYRVQVRILENEFATNATFGSADGF